VVSTAEYLRQHDEFKVEVQLAAAKLAEAKGDWAVGQAKGELLGLQKWIEELKQEAHWRRVGAVEFAGWSEEAYRSVMGKGRTKWWLD
jgi:hypothetical protein